MAGHLPGLLVVGSLAAAPANATSLHATYRLTLAGLTLGNAELDGKFTDERYSLGLKAQLTGIAGLFTSSGRGGASATGTIAGNRLLSAGFSGSGRFGSTERIVQMAVSSGNAGAVEINPPFEPRPDRIPVNDADKRGIIDPLGGILALAASRAKADDPKICDHTIPVFDGTQRFDIVLSFGGTKPVQKPGFTGNVLVCNARYIPVSGHRPARWAVQYMRENRDMSVWLAPVEGTRLLLPIRINIMTYYGMSVVEAERWSVE